METYAKKEEAGESVPQLVMPPLPGGMSYLVDLLFRIGPAVAGEPLCYREIQAWAGWPGHELEGWEAEVLRALSAAWVSEYRAADDPSRPPPFTPASATKDRATIASQLEAMFDRLIARDQKTTGRGRAVPPSSRPAPQGTRAPAGSRRG